MNLISQISYKKFYDTFITVSDEERINKIFLLTNLFTDAIGAEDEVLLYASSYLYLYIKNLDNILDKKDNESSIIFISSLDFQRKSWQLFSKYCNAKIFETYWNKYISITISAFKKRISKEQVKISKSGEMSAFITLIPIALCIKHGKLDKLNLWISFVKFLFTAIQIMGDYYDLIEDSKDNVYNIFSEKLKPYQDTNKYFFMFHKIELELFEKSILYFDKAITIATKLNAKEWLSMCMKWKKEVLEYKNIVLNNVHT